jgi:23S rRNA (cytidine1920-2'-O)/16S rRNA (cytidine1409-2'-O)-methyltransferase
LEKVIADARGSGFLVKGVTHSPLLGAEGNLEFFLWLVAGEEKHSEQGLVERELSEVVRTVVLRAHDLLLNKGGGAR